LPEEKQCSCQFSPEELFFYFFEFIFRKIHGFSLSGEYNKIVIFPKKIRQK